MGSERARPNAMWSAGRISARANVQQSPCVLCGVHGWYFVLS